MSTVDWTSAETTRADAIWSEYARAHDLTGRTGETVGIDPWTGTIWFGRSMADVIQQRDRDGCSHPLFFRRVGSQTYYRKGGHR